MKPVEDMHDLAEDVQGIRTRLAAYRDALRNHAKGVIDDYWDNHELGNNKAQYGEKSNLCVRLREFPNGAIYPAWYWNKWIRQPDGNKKRPLSTHIRKGKGHRYSQRSLLRYAKDWETDLVLETEDELSQVRLLQKEIKELEKALARVATACGSLGFQATPAEPDNAHE